MRTISVALLLAALMAVTACDDSGGEDAPGGDGGEAVGGSGGTGGTGGAGTGGEGGAAVDPTPQLSPVIASFAGRTGRDLVLLYAGTDADGDVVSIQLETRDAAGAPVVALDGDGNRSPDVSNLRIPLPDDVDSAAPSGTLVVRGVDAARVATIAVSLLDAAGHASAEVTATPTVVPVRAMGEACDVAFLRDRCSDGLGCRGEPAVCAEGLAPELERFAYLLTESGAHVLFAGPEPEDDLEAITVEFLDATGNPAPLDLDNDGTPESTSMELPAVGLAVDGTFFAEMWSAPGFEALSPKLAATARDSHGHVGARVEASAAPIPRRSNGQSCDPRGFDTCAVGSVCSPGRVGATNNCQAPAGLRATDCNAAIVVNAGPEEAIVYGAAGGASLWDPPAGCTPNVSTGRPEGIVRIHLGSPAATLALSTVGDGTTFDTVMSVLLACGAGAEPPLACGDDSEFGGYSVLELTNVPAGDYLVVVDSYAREGGAFELHVQTR